MVKLIMANIKKGIKEKSVLTVRIDEDLDRILNDIKAKKGISKADLIRNYLELVKYVYIDQESIRSLDDRDLIIIKRSTFRKYLEKFDEVEQMKQGIRYARYINDIARVLGKIEDLEYKLDLCEHFGFFKKFIDAKNYILISNKFGPKKFVEAFTYKLIFHQPEIEFDFVFSFTEEAIEKSSSVRKDYNKSIQPVDRANSYYAFEFAKIEKEAELNHNFFEKDS
jgi:hypothetical protein